MKEYGWELFAEKCFCSRDAWEEGMDTIPGTWDEENGCWYEFSHRCSACRKKIRNDGEFTQYCPYCGKEMTFVEKVTRTAVK